MITRATLFERFAGRGAELRHLEELRARSQRELRGGTVLVSGEAGVGKSRLIGEFERVGEKERGAFVRVRCAELPTAYAPLAAVLEALMDKRDLRQSNEISTAFHMLTTVDETSTSTAGAGERTRARIDALVSALAYAAKRLGQLTIVIEDAHASDLSSLEAMRSLTRLAHRSSIVLAVTYRPDDLANDNARAAAFAAIGREGADRIVVGPLDYGELSELLRRSLPHASPQLLRRIYELSEGKPYVAEELARSVVERGDGIEFEPTLSLRSAVLERVNQLPPEGRDVMARAAVLGRNFAPDDLCALGVSPSRLISVFRAAVDLQLVEERIVDGAPWFRFRHALTREILYRDLLAIERRSLHGAIAEHLATFDHRTAELAYHLSASGNDALAFSANERAGDEAAGLAAFADAATFFARAASFAGIDAASLARIALKLAEALETAGDIDELLATATRDAERLDRLGACEDAQRVRIVAIRAIAPTRLSDALPMLAKLGAAVDPATPSDLRFTIELLGAKVLRLQGRVPEALAACRRAKAVLPDPTPRQHNEYLLSLAQTCLRLNDLAGADAALQERSDSGAGDGNDVDDAHTIGTMALVAYRRGDIKKAFEKSLAAAAHWDRIGHQRTAMRQRSNAAYFAAEIGDFAYVNRLAEQCRRDGTQPGESLVAASVRVARATGGDPEPYVEQFSRELASGTVYLIYMLARDLAWMLSNEPPRARAILRSAFAAIPADDIEGDFLEAVVEFGSDQDVSQAFALHELGTFGADDVLHSMDEAMARARLALREHRPLEAAQHARTAAALAEKSGHWLTLANALGILGDRAGARNVLEAVGATGELARLERHGAPANGSAPQTPSLKLTAREEQIARLIASGLSNRDTALRLAIAPRTVETHLAHLYAKLGIGSRAELAEHFGARS